MPYPHQPGDAPGELPIDIPRIRQATLLICALDHPLRLWLLQVLCRNEKMGVTALCAELGLEQAETSMHLAELREAGLVQVTKEGCSSLYSVNHQKIKHVLHLFKGLHSEEL